MDEDLFDNSVDAVEVARGIEALDVFQLLDTTAFFESLKLDEEGDDVVTTSASERVKLGPPDEINIDAFLGAQQYVTTYPTDTTSCSDSEESQIEVPRALGAELTNMAVEVESPSVSPNVGDENSKSANNAAKLENFLYNLRRDPDWARSIEYVKLTAAVQRDIQLELINHAYLNVNARPKMMIVMSTTMGAEDITECIKKAFEPTNLPVDKTLFRLYCRNPVCGLKALIKAILMATAQRPDLKVEYTDVLGEMSLKGGKLRMRTSDVNMFLKLEQQGRALGMRFLTTFHCRSSENLHCTMDIRYYDEVKSNGTRASYVHLDHEAFNDQPVQFGGVSVEVPSAINEELNPLRLMYPPVHDLNEIIVKLHKQQLSSSAHLHSP